MIRTQTAIALVSALMLVLAGCAGGVSPAPNGGVDTTAADDAGVVAGSDGGDGGDGTATGGSSAITFYLSDKPSAIDDFEHLNVTITKVGFHRVESAETDATTTANETTTAETTNETPTEPTASDQPTATETPTTMATATATLTAEPEDGDEADDGEYENETEQEQDPDDDEQDRGEKDQEREEDGDGEWVTKDVNDTSVDLTELQGANATKLDVLEVAPGTYDKVFIYVGEIEATLQNGEQVRVKLPSERLHVNERFTVGNGDEIDFVFDVSVFKAGKSGKYILKPIVSQTGTGHEVEIDPVDDDEDGEEKKGGPGEEGTESDESGAGEENGPDDGTDGNETETGALTADLRGPVKSGSTVTLAVSRNGDPVANATVEVNGDRVGTTDADGTIEVDIPQDAEELEITVTKGEAELEIERTIRGSGGNGGN